MKRYKPTLLRYSFANYAIPSLTIKMISYCSVCAMENLQVTQWLIIRNTNTTFVRIMDHILCIFCHWQLLMFQAVFDFSAEIHSKAAKYRLSPIREIINKTEKNRVVILVLSTLSLHAIRFMTFHLNIPNGYRVNWKCKGR